MHNIVKMFKKYTIKEIRHYSWNSLTRNINLGGQWNSINISNDKQLIQKLWNNHISKISCIDYYLSEKCIECVVDTPKGRNFLKWKLFNGEPIWFEYGIYNSQTRYDIYYPEDFKKCPELRIWLIENGKRLVKMYESDKNL